MRGAFMVSLCVVGVTIGSGTAWAQCTRDTECKDDRICEGGRCVDAPQARGNTTPRCLDRSFCPSNDVRVYGYLDRICSGTFGDDDLARVSRDIGEGRLARLDLQWLFNMYGAGWGHDFKKLKHLNTFYYSSAANAWLPRSCLSFRRSMRSIGSMSPHQSRMMSGLKALR